MNIINLIFYVQLDVYNWIFNIKEENSKFELFKDLFDECSFTELKDDLEEILALSDIPRKLLQHEIIGPRIIKAYKKLSSEKRKTDGYFVLLVGYPRSSFQDFELYLGLVVGLDGDDVQII